MTFRRIVGRIFLYHDKCEKVEQFLVLNEKVQGGGTIFGETISVTPVLLHAPKYLSIYAIKVVIKYYTTYLEFGQIQEFLPKWQQCDRKNKSQ